MTGIHRLPVGSEDQASGLTRPALVLADPELMTGRPEAALRASAMNALGHGADSLGTPHANPVSRMAALRGGELIARALDEPRAIRDRATLALGSILCGYAIDSAHLALHHVICQTLVRVCGSPHAETNAAILPHAMAAMTSRTPGDMDDLAAAIGTNREHLAGRILELGGDPPGLGSVGAEAGQVDAAIEQMLSRTELESVPDPPGRSELRQIIDYAW